MNDDRKRRSRGGREARRAVRQKVKLEQFPNIVRNVPITNVLSDEGLEIIEFNAEDVLQEVGVDFKDDEEALQMWRDAGADVNGVRVRIPKGLAREIAKTAPPNFKQVARNPDRSVDIGGKNTVFAPVYGPPFVRDLDGGRRYATMKDFENFVKLAYLSPAMHHSGGTVCEPVDLPVNKRHFDMVYAHIKYSDKPFMGSVTAPERAQDTIEMAKILFGSDFLEKNTVLTSLINANSPMTWDGTMLGALKAYSRANQAVMTSPFILAGAMSPVTVAGTLTQTLAEALAGIAFSQLCRKGAPVIFGSFASSISMQSGSPTFGTPEPALVLFGCAQLARRLNVPFRSGGSLCGSKLPDAQAAYESANTLQASALAGVNFMLHTAGWLEGGLSMGYEKFIMDADQAGMLAVMLEGVELSENAQAMDAFREIGPGGHFLGAAHTQANFESAFYRSEIADNNPFEQWEAEGSLDTAKRANLKWKEMLKEYEAPELDPAIDEALLEFIAKRKSEFEDRDY